MVSPPALIRGEGNTPDGDEMTLVTLDLPAHLVTHLEELRKEFGEELIVDIFRKTIARIQGKLALRGGYRR
jgi:hypothetical protein